MDAQRVYDMANPQDMALLAPGWYWCDSFPGYHCPRVVFVYHRACGRTVSDGNEYTERKLREWVENCQKWGDLTPKFFGPLKPPDEWAKA